MAFGLSDMSKGSRGQSGLEFINSQNVPGIGRPSELMTPDRLAWPGNTILRPLPGLTADLQGIPPWTDADDSFGVPRPAWAYPLNRVVIRAGNRLNKSVTFINELNGEDEQRYTQTPYDRIYDTVKEGESEGDVQLGKLLQGAAGRGAMVPRVGSGTVIQCAVYQKAGKDKTYKWDPYIYQAILLTWSAGKALDKLMFDGDEPNEAMDVVFNPNTDIPGLLCFHASTQNLSLPPGWTVLASSETDSSIGSNDEGRARHVCHIVVPNKGVKIPSEKEVLKRFIPWEHAIRVPSVTEQVNRLCTAFTEDLLIRAFERSEFEALLPAHIRQHTEALTGYKGEPVNESPEPQKSAGPAAGTQRTSPKPEAATARRMSVAPASDEEGEYEAATSVAAPSVAQHAVSEVKKNDAMARLQELRAQTQARSKAS